MTRNPGTTLSIEEHKDCAVWEEISRMVFCCRASSLLFHFVLHHPKAPIRQTLVCTMDKTRCPTSSSFWQAVQSCILLDELWDATLTKLLSLPQQPCPEVHDMTPSTLVTLEYMPLRPQCHCYRDITHVHRDGTSKAKSNTAALHLNTSYTLSTSSPSNSQLQLLLPDFPHNLLLQQSKSAKAISSRQHLTAFAINTLPTAISSFLIILTAPRFKQLHISSQPSPVAQIS